MVATFGQSDSSRLISEREMTSRREFCFGKGVIDGKEYFFEPDSMANSHIMFAGKSQSGKTRTTRKLIEYYGKEKDGFKKTVFVIDYSGDMGVDGENVIPILARKSPYGISLFEFSHDHESGGVLVARDNIVRMINRYFMSNSMGTVQKAVLERLITDTYGMKGIYENDEHTWNNELPTVDDMLELMTDIREAVESSIDLSLQLQIRKAVKRIQAINLKLESSSEKQAQKLEDEKNDLRTVLYKNLERYMDWRLDEEQVGKKLTGIEGEIKHKVDMSFYGETNAFNALKDLRIHIEKIVESKAFSAERPPVINGVNRFDLSKLSVPLQKMFTDILILRTFLRVRARGKYSEYRGRIPTYKIDTVIVVDEAKLCIPSSRKDRESKDEPINRVVAESLKFGLSIVLASQRLDHFSQEILSNVHTKLIFEMGVNDFGSAKSLLGIKERDTEFTKKFGVGLLFSGSKNAIPIALPWAKL